MAKTEKMNLHKLNESQPQHQHQHHRHHQTDGFDRLPDTLILLIFDSVSDIRTLIRCRAVTKRFNSLVPQTEHLFLKVDRVISGESFDEESFLVAFLKSIVKTVHNIISPKPNPIRVRPAQNSPAQILRGFERIRNVEIELPSGDLLLEKGAVIRWKAEFGRSMKSCVILGIRAIDYSTAKDVDADYSGTENGGGGGGGGGAGAGGGIEFEGDGGGLKMRVVWTISALIAASARHYVSKEVLKEHREIEKLLVTDREGEGTVVMDKDGLRECWEEEAHVSVEEVDNKCRTTVPAVTMRMRHQPWLELKGGIKVQGATLVVVKPMINTSNKDGYESQRSTTVATTATATEIEELKEDGGLALGAFEGVYGEIVQALLKSRSYLLEMNSF